MKPMAKPQPKPLVRFRINGGGVHVHDGLGWVRVLPGVNPELMLDAAQLLYNMVRFNPKA
jgi:hypothetical protein